MFNLKESGEEGEGAFSLQSSEATRSRGERGETKSEKELKLPGSKREGGGGRGWRGGKISDGFIGIGDGGGRGWGRKSSGCPWLAILSLHH